jgi:hypothetical protein
LFDKLAAAGGQGFQKSLRAALDIRASGSIGFHDIEPVMLVE